MHTHMTYLSPVFTLAFSHVVIFNINLMLKIQVFYIFQLNSFVQNLVLKQLLLSLSAVTDHH